MQLEEIILSLSSHAPMLLMALIDLTLKGSIVLLAAGMAILTIRSLSASHRHMIWSAALTAIILLPLLGSILPSWQTPLIPTGMFIDAPEKGNIEGRIIMTSSVVTLDVEQQEIEVSNSFAFPRVSWAFWPVVFWLVGAVSIAIWLLAGKVKARMILRSATLLNSVPICRKAKEIADCLSFDRNWKLMISERIKVPMAIGSFSHTILLPPDAFEWPDEKLAMMLTHEMIHIKRRDVLLQWPTIMANALYWFNPLVWLAGHRQLIEREISCDELVLNTGVKQSAYAGCLLEAARRLTAASGHRWATTGMTRGGDFKMRMKSILNCDTDRKPLTLKATFVTVAIAVLFACAAAAWSPWAQANQEGKLTEPPKLIHRVEPELPVMAKEAGKTGSVVVEAVVGKDGLVEKVKAVESSTPGFGFEESAIEAIKQWKFKPSISKGKPVSVLIRFSVEFRLKEKKQDAIREKIFTTGADGELPEPELIHRVQPEFPAKAQEAGKTGSVVIEAILGKDGLVEKAKAVESSTPGFGFEESAIEAVKQWKFKPSISKGKPVQVQIRFTVNFKKAK